MTKAVRFDKTRICFDLQRRNNDYFKEVLRYAKMRWFQKIARIEGGAGAACGFIKKKKSKYAPLSPFNTANDSTVDVLRSVRV